MATCILIISGIILAVLIRIPLIFLHFMIFRGGDSASIGLMAIDASMGKFYTFFYGQGFTGPIEVYFIAPFIKLFGPTNTAIFAGEMGIYTCFLLSIYFLVNEFKGKRAAFYALLYCIVPPFYFFQHSVISLGYYITLLLFGNIILLMTLKINKNNGKFIYYIIFALAAGLGFWNHYSIAFFLIPAALFLLVKVRFKYLLKGASIGILPFFLGSLPYWIYNIRYGFRSLNIYDGHPSIWHPVDATLMQVLKHYVTFQLFGIFDIRLSHIAAWIILVLYIVSIVNLLSKENRKTGWLFIMCIITATVISVKNKFTIWVAFDYRHAMIFVPILTIAVSALAERMQKAYKGLGVIFIAGLLCVNGWSIIKHLPKERNHLNAKHDRLQVFIDFLKEKNIQGFIGEFGLVENVNYLTKRKIVGAELHYGRPPTDLVVDAKDKIAFINCEWAKEDIARLCSTSKRKNVVGYNISYDFVPYPYYGESISRANWHIKTNSNNKDAQYAIDSNLDKFWRLKNRYQKNAFFEIDLGNIYKIFKLEVINQEPHYRMNLYGYKIEVSVDRNKWHEVARFDQHPDLMFWSGPRLYWDLFNCRWQEIFSPVNARYIRITQLNNGNHTWVINEIFVYKYNGEEDFKLDNYLNKAREIYGYLVKNNVNFVYADYWLSGKVREWSKGKIETFNRYNECWPGRKHTSRIMKLNKNSAIVVHKDNEQITDETLTIFNLKLRKHKTGDYVCYFTDNLDEWGEYFISNQNCLYWASIGILGINFQNTIRLFTDYDLKYSKDNTDKKISFLKQAIKLFPRNIPARKELARFSEKDYKILIHKFSPEKEASIEFENGIKFKGYTFKQAGERYQVTYFWELPKDLTENITVFTLFVKDGETVFHNDHKLLEQLGNNIEALPEELFVEKYWFKIPSKGKHKIKIGLFYPEQKGKRIKVKGTGLNKASKATIGEVEIKDLSVNRL